MNFFFGIKSNFFKSKLQIPKFKNQDNNFTDKINLYCIKVKDKNWKLKNLSNVNQDRFFYYLGDSEIDNDNIFFLASSKEISNFEKKKLLKLNDYTSTFPSYRCNFEIYNNFGGFSSFQSEYPHSMINKRGNIFSPINNLLNEYFKRNFLFFKNIIT